MKPNLIFLACPLLLGLLMGLGLKVYDGHGLGLEHDLGLGVAQGISLIGITSLICSIPVVTTITRELVIIA